MPDNTPESSRPYMPGYGIADEKSGEGLLPWEWAAIHLSGARNYFLSTVRSDGRPHAMPVWGVWLNDAFYFSTGKNSVKSRNLQANPNCVLCPERADEAVIVEGKAAAIADSDVLKQFAEAYLAKYQWDVSQMDEPVYAIQPQVVFGFIETGDRFTRTATRWTFR